MGARKKFLYVAHPKNPSGIFGFFIKKIIDIKEVNYDRTI